MIARIFVFISFPVAKIIFQFQPFNTSINLAEKSTTNDVLASNLHVIILCAIENRNTLEKRTKIGLVRMFLAVYRFSPNDSLIIVC